MSKLGYTWYPDQYGNDPDVFELNLAERGLYRELIDMAMKSDNQIEFRPQSWCRKFICTVDELNLILDKLYKLNLVINNNGLLFVPSCEKRLDHVRDGKKGGRPRKGGEKPPTKTPYKNPLQKPPTETPHGNQNKKKDKIKEKESAAHAHAREGIITKKDFVRYIPTKDEFLAFAREKEKNLDERKVILRYEAWKSNDWRDTNNREIRNWKSKLIYALSDMEARNSKPEQFTRKYEKLN